VYIKATSTETLRGPFTVAEACLDKQYTLEDSNRNLVDNEKKFSQDDLEHSN
jgi:hypothetical protein